MSSFISKKEIPPLTEEQLAEIEAIKNMSYDEIDYSDIPPLTDEEVERFRANIRRKKNLKIAG